MPDSTATRTTIARPPGSCRYEHGMIQFTAGVLEASLDVFGLQIRQFLEHLLRCEAVGKQVEHIRHANSHASNAGTSPALFRINNYAVHRAQRNSILAHLPT